MGQKVHPTGIRLGIVKEHTSVWYADSKNYAQQLITDLEAREYIERVLDHASVSRVVIERPAQTARITIHTARPGIVIGKKGEDIEKLRSEVAKIIEMHINDVRINIAEVRKPELDAQLVAEGVRGVTSNPSIFEKAIAGSDDYDAAIAEQFVRLVDKLDPSAAT